MLKIVGPGDPSYLARLVEKCSGLPRITFAASAGPEEKRRLFESASLHVLPSLSENFGVTVVEALSYGVPVLTTNGTPWASLQSRNCGWWTEQGVGALCAALDEALSTSECRLSAMGANGRRWMEDEFSWHHVSRRMHAVYEWLANRGARPACVRLPI
jgi:glycosyltransferase involved in cell wall biosynthesis